MKKTLFFIAILLTFNSNAQETLSELLKKNTTHSVPYITVQELAMPTNKAIIIDAREIEEFQVSHIKKALHVGFKDFKIEDVQQKIPNKNQVIVIYCSLGIRSEKIAEKLKKVGYTSIKNLYGGIFEWKNNNFEVYNTFNKPTDSIHAFSKSWSSYLNKGIKVYGTQKNKH